MLSMSRSFRINLPILGFITLLTACGGGGDSGSVAVAIDYPFATANSTWINNAFTHNFNLSGTQVVGGVTYNVTGSGASTQTAASGGTFEGQVALVNTQTVNMTITVNSVSAPVSSSILVYSTSNYAPLGMVDNDTGEYCVMQGTPTIPATVKVGDSAALGTFTCYADSSKAAVVGTSSMRYVIEADTANTAMISIITEEYDAGNVLQLTDRAKWRIDTLGNVTFVSETAIGPDYTYNLLP